MSDKYKLILQFLLNETSCSGLPYILSLTLSESDSLLNSYEHYNVSARLDTLLKIIFLKSSQY